MPQHPPHHYSCRRRFLVAQEQGWHRQCFHVPGGSVSFMLASDFLGSDVPWVMWSGAKWVLCTHYVCITTGTLSLETPNLIKDLQANLPNPCPQRRHYLSSKAVNTNTLEKVIWNKSCHKTCRNTMENCSQHILEAEIHAFQVTR